MVESLTQQKLENATKIDDLSKQVSNRDVSIKQLQSKSDELIIENEALKRQTQRFTEENESLLSQMELMDANNANNAEVNKLNDELISLKKQFDEKCNDVISMKDLNDNNSAKIKKLIQENSDLKASIDSNNAPVDEIKVKYDVVVKKLKAYREKLFTIYDQAKLLKAEKGILLSLTREYSENVSKWQKDICQASTRLIIQLKELKADNRNKDAEIEDLKNQLSNISNNDQAEVENLKKEVNQLNEKLKAKEKLIDDERETRKKTVGQKKTMLDLEIEAFEKTLEEINKKLEAKKKQVIELEGTIANQNQTINSLKNQISALEENLESEKSHSIELKKNLDNQLNLLRKTEHERTETNLQLDLMTKNFESLKLENSESKFEMTKTISDMEKRHQQLENERHSLTTNISYLENEVDKYRKLSSNHEKEIENTRAEFASYKIRAQSVLRQNQTKDLSKEQELQDEVITLQATQENLKESHAKLAHELENLKKNYNDLVEDKVRLQGRCKDLLTTLEKHSDEVLEESRKRNQEHEEAVKAYQLQIDTLNTFYKKRTQELEESKKSAIAELQEKLNALERNIPSLNASISYTNTESPPKNDDHKISNMLDLMDREVEGSEDQSSQSTYAFTSKRKISRNRELMPLDELLNASFDDNSNEVNEDTISNYSSRSEVLEHLRVKLDKEESRVTHLTALLADNEKDLAKMQQLNDMLKEEIRRNQRSVEREQHIQNSEYLKNIVIKFVTLNNGDEKQRLIPVLNTILKLSSDEIQTLQNACKGGWGLFK